MSSNATTDSRDVQESVERTREAEAHQYEALRRKYGADYADRLKESRETARQKRIKANEDRLDEMDAEKGIIRGKAPRDVAVYHE